MSSQPSSTLRDPSILFFQSDTVRRSILLSYWLVIISALPLWWYTTSITRLALPSTRVHTQSQNHLRLPVRICIPTSDARVSNDLQGLLENQQSRAPSRWKGLDLRVVNANNCDEAEGTYTLFSNPHELALRQRQLQLPLTNLDAKSIAPFINTISNLLLPPQHERKALPYSPRYRLAFSLLNEDATAGEAPSEWDCEGAIKYHILPILGRLSTLHNFTIESQVQFHAPLAFQLHNVDDEYHGLTPEDLTVFVNSAEWTLSSSASNDPVIHFILFVPSANRRPVRILEHTGNPSEYSAFLIPQWGGIVLHNPSQDDLLTKTGLSSNSLDQVFSSFANQLLVLLGVSPLPSTVLMPDSNAVLTEWQLDALLRRRALENAEGARDTLLSIIKLVDQIGNMPVGEGVRDDIQNALTALEKMDSSSQTSLSETFRYSASAYSLSSKAFFNPDMLALLYFPAEHKYAVYTPLFASAIIPLVVAAVREFRAWKRRNSSPESSTEPKS